MQHLRRYPYRKNDLLQAWDSADELLIDHLRTMNLEAKRILIVNDHYGALSMALTGSGFTTYTDSFVSTEAIKINSQGKVTPVNHFCQWEGIYDYVFIQIPKNQSYFEDILCHLTHHLREGSQIICGSMVKHLAPSSFDLIGKYIGPTTTSLALKKARLIFASFEKEKADSPYPLKVTVEGFEKPFINHSNLFSREKLDIGTRFLLENMPGGAFDSILDLGCANGIIGISAKLLFPAARIAFSDESAMAIESARVNYRSYFTDEAEFYWTNCFESGEKQSKDLILCNPPFHQSNTIGDFIAWQMFTDAKEALKKGGLLRVIGNSHLGYQLKLKKLFTRVQVITKNKKFMIIDAYK